MKLEKLKKESTYHIFNRGIDKKLIFKTEENKRYFLSLLGKYLVPHVSVYAYVLMRNHFHLLIKVNAENKEVTKAFSDFLNAYAKAFNKQQNRTGSLFQRNFKRKLITDDKYFANMFSYIHNNPKNNIETETYSSYTHYLNKSQPDSFLLDKDIAFKLFDSIENMRLVTNQRAADPSAEPNGSPAQARPTGFSKPCGSKREAIRPAASQREAFVHYIRNLQDTITSKLEAVDGGAKFQEDLWNRPEGGGGRTRVFENGAVFEKGGVNISEVHGKLPESMQQYFGVKDANFFACGLSLVLHPVNPMVPTVHANWRYFEMYNKEGEIVDQWFGGGQDLTPYYLFEEDARHFHQVCKTACDKHNPDFYPKYKARCDEYFYNPHRSEARGIGGLFFDYCKVSEEMTMKNWLDFVTEIGDSFLNGYVPIVEKRKDSPFTKAQKGWQEIRRGRYVEFNLVHDKGTLFGLKTNGRIESILMSLPPKVQWVYDHHPEAGSDEEKLINVLKQPIDWV